jgi:hypothetical protein
MNKKILAVVAGILGIIFIVIAVIYFITPAKSLPAFFPGHDVMVTKTHFKHGIGAFFLGLACFAFAWFQSGKKKNNSDNNPPAQTQ